MRKFLLILCFFYLGSFAYSQNKDAKWTIGLSGSLVNFGDSGPNSVGDRFLYQFPKLSLSRYILPSLTLDLSSTISTLDEVEGFYSNAFNYFSIDGTLRYDFGLHQENLVPYIGLGIGWINGPETISNSKSTPTTNFVFGGTFWFSSHVGFNAEAIYKHSRDEYESMRSHTQVSVGIVYSFRPRQLVQRLWHGRR